MVCHADPCAKSVQYLDLMNTLIFPKIFSTGDILTLVDHTLIDHTACIPTVLLIAYSCPLDGKGWICAYPLVEHVFVTTFLCGKFLCLPLWVRMFRQGLAVRSVGHVFVRADDVVVRRTSESPSCSTIK